MNARPDWSDQTCVILASGPSLTAEQVAAVSGRGMKLIAVNATYKIAHHADVLYAGDFLFWKIYLADIKKNFAGQLWTQDGSAAERYKINYLKGVNEIGLGKKFVHMNGNSGFQAINLAYLFGCRRVLLLGFDMKTGPKGEKHWHADHPNQLMQAQCFGDWIHKSTKLAEDLAAAGCDVVNCTPGSALTCFRVGTIEKELA